MSTETPARLKVRYMEEIRPQLIERFGYSSSMQTPRLEKITLNMGVGDAKQDSKALKAAQDQLATIAGQQPSVRRARKSIAAFKLREGMPVGVVGDPAPGALLRVPRPADLDRDPPYPRLPRPARPLVRRPRQLLDGGARTDHLPRDRLRRDRPGARAGHHDHHQRAHRRGGLRAALRAGDALLHLRPAGGVREASATDSAPEARAPTPPTAGTQSTTDQETTD